MLCLNNGRSINANMLWYGLTALSINLKNINEMGDEDYKLWKFFKEEHELILTDGQINDILREVENYQRAKSGLTIPIVAVKSPNKDEIRKEAYTQCRYRQPDKSIRANHIEIGGFTKGVEWIKSKFNTD